MASSRTLEELSYERTAPNTAIYSMSCGSHDERRTLASGKFLISAGPSLSVSHHMIVYFTEYHGQYGFCTLIKEDVQEDVDASFHAEDGRSRMDKQEVANSPQWASKASSSTLRTCDWSDIVVKNSTSSVGEQVNAMQSADR